MKPSVFAGLFLTFPLLITTATADSAARGETVENSDIEVVLVTGVRIHDQMVLEPSQVAHTGLDNSDLMRMFPGGNRNANGPLTRISQYRGLIGAQNNVLVDGAGYSADCPNWMDTPLSSIPQSLTESVTLYRGLASVKTVQEGLGNGIAVRSRNGGFAAAEDWAAYGNATAGYGSNASAWNASVFSGWHNDRNWLDVAASVDRGDDYGFDGGTVAATEYDRSHYRFGYGGRLGGADLALRAAINRTGNAGTPALPMDMRYLDSEQYAFEFNAPAGPGTLHFSVDTLSVDHVMDNFTLRPVPLNKKGKPTFRESAPLGDTDALQLSYQIERGALDWEFGLDGKWESHDHPVADPTNAEFFIDNFSRIERDRLGVFATATWTASGWDLEAGLRYNRVEMDAGEVGGNLAIPPMSPMFVQQERLDKLAAEFNAADRARSDDQWTGVFKASRDLGENLRLNLGLGRKARSPSYQERYLWLPMSATAGLADGWTYIGDLDLVPETSLEATAGLDWSFGGLRLTPEVFYRDISNFIQGTPSTNMTANQFAMMATGRPPLQYGNVDAEQYGFDMGYEWHLDEHFLLRGTLSYVRGKRTDIEDNLYRIAPLTSVAELMYLREGWFVSLESVAAARQDRVADYNAETESAGWGVLNVRAAVELGDTFDLGLGVENLFDKVYRDHLGGYNRVRESDVPLGARIISMGRNLYLKLNAKW
ncbi:MAG: TonB-dependent receptor [Gammaproteobacteria bacterium]|nr:TonB-dependent receptor [Gammaproteobacteria bacterium]